VSPYACVMVLMAAKMISHLIRRVAKMSSMIDFSDSV
jgi:hypothetical protein